MNDNNNFDDVLNTLSKQQKTDDSQDNEDTAAKKWFYDPTDEVSRESLLNATVDGFKNIHGSWDDKKTDLIKDILADEHWFYIILIVVGTQYSIQNTIDASTGDFWESDSDYAQANKLNDEGINSLIECAITNAIGEAGRDEIFEKLQTKYPFSGYLNKHGIFSSSVLLKSHEVNGVKDLSRELEYIAALIKREDLSRHIAGFMCTIAMTDGHIDKTEQLLITRSIKTVMIGIDRELEPDIKKVSEDYLSEIKEENNAKAKVEKEEKEAKAKVEKEEKEAKAKVEKEEKEAKAKVEMEASTKMQEKAGEEMIHIMGFGNHQLGEKAIISYPRFALTLFFFIFIIVNEIFISGFLVGLIGIMSYAFYKVKKNK